MYACMCVYVHMYIYIHIHMYVCICIYVYVYVYIYLSLSLYIYIYIRDHMSSVTHSMCHAGFCATSLITHRRLTSLAQPTPRIL